MLATVSEDGNMMELDQRDIFIDYFSGISVIAGIAMVGLILLRTNKTRPEKKIEPAGERSLQQKPYEVSIWKKRYGASVLFKFFFGIIAILLFIQTLQALGSHQTSWFLEAAGLMVFLIAMIIPGERISKITQRLQCPGRILGFLSKLFGWFGASMLPYAVYTSSSPSSWFWVAGCVFIPIASLALWAQRPWAAWSWYAISIAFLSASAYLAILSVGVVPTAASIVTADKSQQADALLALSFICFAVGLKLIWDTWKWHRSL